jgi:hypothetical protein
MAPCSGRLGLPIYICEQIAPPERREPPPECERARTKVRPAKKGGSRCHRSGRRRIRHQAGRARRRSPSPRRRPRAANSRGSARPSGTQTGSPARTGRARRASARPSGPRSRRLQRAWICHLLEPPLLAMAPRCRRCSEGKDRVLTCGVRKRVRRPEAPVLQRDRICAPHTLGSSIWSPPSSG